MSAMTVEQLRDKLALMRRDAMVILSSDEEGNGFGVLWNVEEDANGNVILWPASGTVEVVG